VRSAAELGLEVALDLALQCAPDHLGEGAPGVVLRPRGWEHPVRENPPKKYEDIYPLDFWCEDSRGALGRLRDVVFFWVDQGVRTFRVDNPHTKPIAFWEWLIQEVQRDHPT
jgi:starch synthase (maltosyl-transferring)